MEVRYDSEEQLAGSTLGPYDLLARIGVGGMARVWAARVRGTSDVVAVKMLLPELAENVEFRKMFFDEARIASRVRHPNVCSTFKMGEQSGVLFLAMEWLDGPSLARVLRPGHEDDDDRKEVPIGARLAARILADACAGLQAAHDLVGDDGRPLGVVHRDVSPQNLLITSEGAVKVTDFGVAKALGKSHMTMVGQLKGKLAYMAPEQLSGGTVDRRCDVFALGCVLYEITTGQRPFRGEHDPQIMTAIVLGQYEPPATVIPGYPHALSIIVMRALANDLEDRYPSAEHMREALEAYLRTSGPPVGAAQIAALIRERCGDEMAARANALRGVAAAPAVPRPPASSAENRKTAFDSGSGAMMVVDGRPTTRQGTLWMICAALIGAALGIAVLSYVRTTRKPKAEATAASAAPSGATRTVAEQGRVRLHVVPPSADVFVDGVALARGSDTVIKPPVGTTLNVVVRADKHEDTLVMIDSASPSDLDVALVPNAVAIVAPASSAHPKQPRRRPDAGSSAKNPYDAPVTETPPNPYE